MATVGGLVVYLTLNAVGLRHGLAQARGELAAFQTAASGGTLAASASKDFAMITKGATVAGLAILGIGAASIKAATTFEFEMKLLRVQAGASSEEVKNMSAAILEMSAAAQHGPRDLARGLFHIESVGIRGAEALEVLTIAAQGARVGNASLEGVTNALVATIMSGIEGVDSFSEAMGVLNGIVGTGNLRMEQLAKSFASGTLSTAKQFGLTIQNLGAALATLSDQGVPPQEAMTRLRITITLLGAPTRLAAEQLAGIGLAQDRLAREMRGPNGLVGALRLLKAHMDDAGLDVVEQSLLLKTAFGGSRSSAGILTLINSLDLFDQKLVVINAKMKSFPADFAAQQKTAAAHFNTFGAQMEVIAVRIGNALLPIVLAMTDIIVFLTSNTEVVAAAFTMLAIVVGITLVNAFFNMTSAAFKMIGAFAINIIQTSKWGRALTANIPWITATGTASATTAGQVAAASAVSAGAIAGVGVAASTTAASVGLSSAQVAAASFRMAQSTTAALQITATSGAASLLQLEAVILSTSTAFTLVSTQAQTSAAIILPAMQQLSVGISAALLQIPARVAHVNGSMVLFNQTFASAALGVSGAASVMLVEISGAMHGLSAEIAAAAASMNVSFAAVRAGFIALSTGPQYLRQTRSAGGMFGPMMTEAQMYALVIMEVSNTAALAIQTMAMSAGTSINLLIGAFHTAAQAARADAALIGAATAQVAASTQAAAASVYTGTSAIATIAAPPLAVLRITADSTSASLTRLAIASGAVRAPMLLLTAGTVQAAAAQVGLGLGTSGLSGIMVGATATAKAYSGQLLLAANAQSLLGASAATAAPAVGLLNKAMLGGLAARIGGIGASVGALATRFAIFAGIAPAAAAGMGAVSLAAGTLTAVIGALVLPITLVVGAWVLMDASVDKVSRGIVGLGTVYVWVWWLMIDIATKIPFIGKAFEGLRDSIGEVVTSMHDIYNELDMRIAQEELENAALAVGEGVGSAYEDGAAVDSRPLGQKLIDDWGVLAGGVRIAARDAGSSAMGEYAKAILDGRDEVRNAIKAAMDASVNTLAPMTEMMQLIGFLTSDALAEGLNSEDGGVVASWIHAEMLALERIDLLSEGAYSAGVKGVKSYEQGIEDARKEVNLSDSFKLKGDALEKWNEKYFIDVGDKVTPSTWGLTDEYKIEIKEQIDLHNSLIDSWNAMSPSQQEANRAFYEMATGMDLVGTSSVSLQTQIAVLLDSLQDVPDLDLTAYREFGYSISEELLHGVSDGMKNAREQLSTSLEDLHGVLQQDQGMTRERQAGFLIAQLWGQDIQDGLSSTVPGVQAETLAIRESLFTMLDALSPNEFSEGDRAAFALARIGSEAQQLDFLTNQLGFPPDMAQGAADLAAWLEVVNANAKTASDELADMASDAKSNLTSTFDTIKQKAEDYFRAIHDGNMQAIEDAHDQKNAWLDAKMAREQRPINQAQSALEHRQAQQREFSLRQSVTRATDPESRLKAVWALRNFLDQQHIDKMQKEADKNKSSIERQKDRNDELYTDQKDAENKRYDLQKRSFNRQLAALERFLKAHPEMWATAQDKVLRLLGNFGVNFEDVGTKLGKRFRNGIRRQIVKIMNDLAAIAEYDAAKAKGEGDSSILPDWFFGLFPAYASGTQRVSRDQLAFLHKDEMVVPAVDANKVRGMNRNANTDDSPIWSPTRLPTFDSKSGGKNDSKNGGGTIILQIGTEKIAELTDRSLYVQETIYGKAGGQQTTQGRSVR